MKTSINLGDLIKLGRIKIIPEDVYSEYTQMGLEKFIANFDFCFNGNIDVDLIFTKKGNFVIQIMPSDKKSYIEFIKDRKTSEEHITWSYGNCTQIRLKGMDYQIHYSL